MECLCFSNANSPTKPPGIYISFIKFSDFDLKFSRFFNLFYFVEECGFLFHENFYDTKSAILISSFN